MFARTLNELQVTLAITVGPESLLLIKEGRHRSEEEQRRRHLPDKKYALVFNEDPRLRRRGKDVSYYKNAEHCFDMAFVFSRTAEGDRYYLPGSSLRGVLRQAAERAIATLRPDLAVDPFARHDERWAGTDRPLIAARDNGGNSSDVRPDGARIYREARPIERCFGHTLLRSRWLIRDAWNNAGALPGVTIRDGVGIDRATGAARESIKFDFEALTSGTFITTLKLENYELWQLGLLAHTLAALDGGDVRLGYGTRRGLGRARWQVRELAFRWYPERIEAKSIGADVITLEVPTLSTLAEQAKITGDYGWREQNLKLTLPLRYEPSLLAGSWVFKPSAKDDPWMKAPWPSLGPLLSQGLDLKNWPAQEEAP